MKYAPMFRRGFAGAFLDKLLHKPGAAPAPLPATQAPAHLIDITSLTVSARPAAPAPAVVPANADGMLNLGQIAARLGYKLPAEFLGSMGIQPAGRDRSAVLYREADFLRLLDGLDQHHAQLRGAYLRRSA